ncbi:MAG: SLC13 family permease [Proteobacteria bacterium]|nr:SLC13 family permease [Pseudomonadota bacterium]
MKMDLSFTEHLHRALFLKCLTLVGLGVLTVSCADEAVDAGNIGDTTSLEQHTKNSPRIVSARIIDGEPRIVAGEEGSLDVEVLIRKPEESTGQHYVWDRDAPPPVLWISAPSDCGVHFRDGDNVKRPDQQALIKLKLPAAENGKITARVKYHVEPRVKAIHSYFWFDVSASIVAEDGSKIQDAGEVLAPIKIDTHFDTKLLVLAVIAIAVFLFIVEWVRVDVVAIMIMVALPELGLIDARDTFRGLSSNAVIAIIGVMIISFALNRTGLVNRTIQPVQRFIGKSSLRLMVVFSGLIAAVSSVMQNTGAAVLFLPAIRTTASKVVKIPVSRVLMPIGMSAILGGTLTMIGTSPLILLNDLLPTGMPKFGFLELTPIGIALVIGGITYFAITGGRFLNNVGHDQAVDSQNNGVVEDQQLLEEYRRISGPFEMFVPEDYTAGEGPQRIVDIRRRFLVNIVALATRRGIEDSAPSPETVIRPGIGLCAFGPRKKIENFARDYHLVLREKPRLFKRHIDPAVTGVVEVVISPRSTLIGRTITEARFRQTYGVNALALHQDGKVIYRKLADKPLNAGDAVLLHGTWEQFQTLKDLHRNFIFTSSTEVEIQKPNKALSALICFVSTLVLMLVSSFHFQGKDYNPMPLSICLMAGALGMILSRVVSIQESYNAVDWRTIFLLGGLLPLGQAVDQTGTAEWIANGIVIALGNNTGPLLLLIVLACLSAALTLVISNVGACALLVPLGISLANQIGIEPRVAAIVVGIGVSNSFIIPTHQVNALYMGPGGYRTTDYLKVGGPLSLLYIVILVAMTYVFYL